GPRPPRRPARVGRDPRVGVDDRGAAADRDRGGRATGPRALARDRCARGRTPCADPAAPARGRRTACGAAPGGRPRRPGSRARRDAVTDLGLSAPLDDPTTGVIVCTGAGGDGKTTTAAALALHAAERGRRVVVLTIDPARRLAQALGLTELDNTPRPVIGVDTTAGGSLDAMMLDMKRTFDEAVLSHADPETAR